MDELDLFRDFRRGVVAPTADVRERAAARLTDAVNREQSTGRVRWIVSRPRYVALALVAVALASAAALFVSTPWNNSPGFLPRAQAALAPHAGMILHERWTIMSISKDPACTVIRGPSEIWIDQTPPYKFRALLNEFPLNPAGADPRALVCSNPMPSEVGGTLDPAETVVFVPPSTITSTGTIRFGTTPDPLTWLRDAIVAGNAHDEGKTQLGGRTVELIRIDPPPDCTYCSNEPTHAYVDPDTFAPVRIESPHGYIVLAGKPPVRFDAVKQTLVYEYLPRTEANLALTSIQAQHPNATGP